MYCVVCSHPCPGFPACVSCITAARNANKTAVDVNFCHHCGGEQDQTGTECSVCQARREHRRMRASRRIEVVIEQQTLWTA